MFFFFQIERQRPWASALRIGSKRGTLPPGKLKLILRWILYGYILWTTLKLNCACCVHGWNKRLFFASHYWWSPPVVVVGFCVLGSKWPSYSVAQHYF